MIDIAMTGLGSTLLIATLLGYLLAVAFGGDDL